MVTPTQFFSVTMPHHLRANAVTEIEKSGCQSDGSAEFDISDEDSELRLCAECVRGAITPELAGCLVPRPRHLPRNNFLTSRLCALFYISFGYGTATSMSHSSKSSFADAVARSTDSINRRFQKI
jgi:hypothetical protein